LDPDVVRQRLAHIEELVAHLARHKDVTADELGSDIDLRHSALWILTQLVAVAASVNGHISAACLGRAAATYREGFALAADAGAVSAELLPSLFAAAGMRNVLVHEYGDIDLSRVAEAIPPAVTTFAAHAKGGRPVPHRADRPGRRSSSVVLRTPLSVVRSR